MDIVPSKEIYTPGYSSVAVRYMMRRHAGRDAGFLMSRLRKGMSLLDCGCGPGTISIGLAEVVTPGSVIGIDLEQGQVDMARQEAQRCGAANLRFEIASVYDLPFPAEAFDVVFSHALFEHLTDPARALKEIRRVLRAGGAVAISSPDWSGNLMAPRDQAADEAIDFYKLLQAQNGGNPYIGRELGRLLQQTGFSSVELTAMYDCYEDVGLFADLIAERIEKACGPGHSVDMTTDSSRISRADALRQWAKQPAVLYAQSFVEAIGYVMK